VENSHNNLFDALIYDRNIDSLYESIDDILIWFSKSYKTLDDGLSARLLKEATPAIIEEKMFTLLDKLLFSRDDLGFNYLPPDQSSLKLRYHRLLQVYHPDKANFQTQILNKRTEQINAEYNRLKKLKHSNHVVSVTKKPIDANFVFKDNDEEDVGFYQKTKKVRYLTISVLILLSLAFISVLYVNNNDVNFKTQEFSKQTALFNVVDNKKSAHNLETIVGFTRSSSVLSQDKDLSKSMESSLHSFIDSWKAAWENQETNEYLSYYSPRFSPQDMTYSEWLASRKLALDNKKFIKVKISNVEIIPLRDEVIVKFKQQYFSDTVIDDVDKRLLLKEVAGKNKWEILEENASR